jgi:hypothetical protein
MSHREEAPRQQLTAPDSSETPEARTPLTDELIKKYEPSSLLHQFQQVVSLARSLELSLSQCREALEKERKDAERYRIVRNGGIPNIAMIPINDDLVRHMSIDGDELDAAIDAALPSAPKE